MRLLLNPGTICVANGRVIQIDGVSSISHVDARDMGTGKMISVPIAQIEELPSSRGCQEAGTIHEAEWKRCSALAKDLIPLKERARVTRGELEKLAKRHDMSVRQLQRVLVAYKKNPRTSTLARQPGGRPKGLSLLDPSVDALIRHAIAKHYMRREKPPKEYVVLRAQSMARRLGLPPPSRKAVLLRLNQELGWASDLTREGSRATRQKWDVRTGGLSAAKPLDLNPNRPHSGRCHGRERRPAHRAWPPLDHACDRRGDPLRPWHVHLDGCPFLGVRLPVHRACRPAKAGEC